MIRRFIPVGLLLSLLVPAAAMAQSSFAGTWKVDVNSMQFSAKPSVVVLQNGDFQTPNSVPPVDVKADGQDHPVTGSPSFDAVNIKVLDDRSIEQTFKKSGTIVAVLKGTVSADGKAQHLNYTISGTPNTAPVTYALDYIRVAAGPPGSHAISGSWQITKLAASENALVWTYRVEGDTLRFSNPIGQSYAAKLDGTDAPFKGNPDFDSVSAKRISQDTIEETDKRGGKPVRVVRGTVTPDGKTMNVTEQNLLEGTTIRYSVAKQ